MKNFLRRWLGVPDKHFIQREIEIIVKDSLLDILSSDGTKDENKVPTTGHSKLDAVLDIGLQRLLGSYTDLEMQYRLRKAINTEKFIDNIVLRIKDKQL